MGSGNAGRWRVTRKDPEVTTVLEQGGEEEAKREKKAETTDEFGQRLNR